MKSKIEDGKFKFKIKPMTEIYYNEDSFYGIYKFSTNDDIPELESLPFGEAMGISTIVGKMQRLTIGVPYECTASLTLNKKYKKYQYEVESLNADKPKTREEQESFLRCLLTEKQASSLLEVYPDIIEIVLDNKEIDLSKVKGIGDKSFEKIRDKILENYVLSDVLTMLKPYGVTINAIKKLMAAEQSVVILKQKLGKDPYMLTKIKGFGFKKVDSIAIQINPSLRVSKQRLLAFINYHLSEIGNNEGHSKIELDDLTKVVKSNISECMIMYGELLDKEMTRPNLLHIYDSKVGLKSYHDREKEILEMLRKLDESDCGYNISDSEIDISCRSFAKERGYSLTDEQKSILIELNKSNVILLTGKGGAGKSSSIDVVIRALKDKNISMCALSAKAVRRMVETTGVQDCKTIHRLLGFQGKEFEFTKENPLKTDILIIDESSMVNSSLFHSLISAVSPGTKVLIVFDDGQLPPIGVGNIATDLLTCGFSHVALNKVHRQAAASGILSDANIIRDGINPIDKPSKMLVRGELKDMYYVFNSDKQEIFDTAIKYYMKSLEKISIEDISIVVPRKSNAINSTESFNIRLQDILLRNESKKVQKGDRVFKLGAKVIQKVNNYDKDVVNGEIGFVTKIIGKEFEVTYDKAKVVKYEIKDMDELELAYALTVHSMQGSQCHTIIFVCDTSSYILLSKELIYTAITRASKRCMVIAEPKAFNLGCQKKAGIRNTWLKKKLGKLSNNLK